MRRIVALTFIVVLFSSFCHAEIYRYRNEKGVLCFTDDIDKVPEDQRPDVQAPSEGDKERKRGVKKRRGENRFSEQLLSVAGTGDLASVKRLLEKGADVRATDGRGETALMKAARNGNYPVAKLLIDYGAEVNAKDHLGATALMHAQKSGHEEIIGLLRGHGAKENQ